MIQRNNVEENFSNKLAELILFGSPTALKNSRQFTGERLVKGKQSSKYDNIFYKQIFKQIEKYEGIFPITSTNYLYKFDIYYKNKLSDVSIEGLFDLFQSSLVVVNDNIIRHYSVNGFIDKICPRTIISIYSEEL